MHRLSGQRGFSFAKLFILLTFLAMCAMVFFKLFPPYMDEYAISTALNATVDEANRSGMTPLEIRDGLIRRLGFNNITKIQKGDIKIVRDAYTYRLSIEYEERIHFIHNIDFLLTFSHSAEVKAF